MHSLELALAVSAKLLPVHLTDLSLLDAIVANLLTPELTVLRLLDAIHPHMPAVGRADLRLLNAIGANLLALDASGTLRGDPGLLHALHARWAGLTFRPHLEALGACRAVGSGKALRTLHSRRGHLLHALHSGRRCTFGALHLLPHAATAALLLLYLSLAALTAMRSGLGRGCNRRGIL